MGGCIGACMGACKPTSLGTLVHPPKGLRPMLEAANALSIAPWNSELARAPDYSLGWEHQYPCTHQALPPQGHQIYTDGSQITLKDGSTATGAGIHNATTQSNRRVDPGGVGSTHTNNRAELSAILVALESVPQTEEVTIYTDSLCSLQNIQKQLNSPNRLRESNHRALLHKVVEVLGERALAGTHTHLFKVRAHTGIPGNEVADRLAKEAALNKATTDTHVTLGEVARAGMFWPKTTHPTTQTPHTPANLTQAIKACLPSHTQRGPTRKAGVYTTLWDDQLPTLQGGPSSHFWQDSTLTWPQKLNLLRARWGHLWNKKLAYRYKMPYAGSLGPVANGNCPLCKTTQDGASHIMAGCTHPQMKKAYIKRHDLAVKLIQRAISKGGMGGCLQVMDAGKLEELPPTVWGKRLPPTLCPPSCPLAEWARMRPDILIMPGLAHPAQPHPGEQYEIHIVEIGYCGDTNHHVKIRQKELQHASLVAALKRAHHRVRHHVVTLGTTGTIHSALTTTLDALGVERAAQIKLMAKLHRHATTSAGNILAMRRHEEWHPAVEPG